MKKYLPWLIGAGVLIYFITSSKTNTKKQVPGQSGGDDNTYGDTIRGPKYVSI
ncbi:MAG: hypothetical protein V9E90_01495 [Saprospiraceae bacterium]